MRKKLRVGMVFTFPVSELRGDFLSHFPIRMKTLLKEDIDLFVIFTGALNKDKIAKNNIKALQIPKIKFRMLERCVFPLILFFYSLVFSKKYDLDILINANSHKWMLPVAIAGKICGSKTIATVGGDILRRTPRRRRHKICFIFNRTVEKLSLCLVDRIHCVSYYLRDVIIKRAGQGDKIYVMSRGVDTNKFKMPSKSFEKPAERLIFVGRLQPIKGLKYALAAFQSVRSEGYRLSFDIYGSGSEGPFLEKKYAHLKGVRFHGHISHDRLPFEMAKGGILVLPSLDEGFPNVLLEAMASGVIVIASNVSDNAILLKKGRRGLLVQAKQPEEIKQGIMFLMENKEYVKDAIFSANRYIQGRHSFVKLKGLYRDKLFNFE